MKHDNKIEFPLFLRSIEEKKISYNKDEAIAFLKNQLDGNLLQFHYIITSSDVFTNFSRHSYNYRRK